ncbi:MAG: peptide ABC transporter permease [Waddliaceae bacterium]|nr:peptide ABC transporter permease [Waddliaceae bacterium]
MKEKKQIRRSYWQIVWQQYSRHKIGILALLIFFCFFLIAIYAPFLASSQPIFISYDGNWYFPLLRHLFYPGFFSKRLDIFYNLLMFTLPLAVIYGKISSKWIQSLIGFTIFQFTIFSALVFWPPKDPGSDPSLNQARHTRISASYPKDNQDPLLAPLPEAIDWNFDLEYMNEYAKLEELIAYTLNQKQNNRLKRYQELYAEEAERLWLSGQKRKLKNFGKDPEESKIALLNSLSKEEHYRIIRMPTLWETERENERDEIRRQEVIQNKLKEKYLNAIDLYEKDLELYRSLSGLDRDKNALRGRVARHRYIITQYQSAVAKERYIKQKQAWLESESQKIGHLIMPLIRHFHWEDDAGGEQSVNQYVDWWELTRSNRKDLVAALIFGTRISLVVGVAAVALSLLIGIPIGAIAGYYGGKTDIVISRILEVWEGMPVLFMLLLVTAILQSKSIFLVIFVIGVFGWTGISRYVRGEFLKQRNLPYIDACRAMGFSDSRIIFSHALPNAIPPLLTLLPFAIMGAITSEAGLSFLGLGEEGSCSWGVLMDEGRAAFPGESYLLWPPAILLSVLLISVALVGDALRDALDPKMRR